MLLRQCATCWYRNVALALLLHFPRIPSSLAHDACSGANCLLALSMQLPVSSLPQPLLVQDVFRRTYSGLSAYAIQFVQSSTCSLGCVVDPLVHGARWRLLAEVSTRGTYSAARRQQCIHTCVGHPASGARLGALAGCIHT